MPVLVGIGVPDGNPVGAVVSIDNISILVGNLLAAECVALKHHAGVRYGAEAFQLDGALECGTAVVLHDLDLGIGRADGRVGAVLVGL